MACRREGITTLQRAIKDKYCLKEEQGRKARDGREMGCKSFEVGLAYRPGGCPVHKLTSIVLDKKGVAGVEEDEEESLTKLCPCVEELHLSNNSIALWKDVSMMLRSLPALKLLNLGHNPLVSSSFSSTPPERVCDHLCSLVLNGTNIEWQALETFLNTVPQLQELHLSMNDYREVCFSNSFRHNGLKHLQFNDNKVEQWKEVAKLSLAFPNLQKLIAAGNPIKTIPTDLDPDTFTKLHALNLNNSALSSWDSIECLHVLRMLRELSVLKIPLGQQMDVGKRRKAFVARLPGINMLNKTTITESERESSERWLIRELRDTPNPPAIYHELVKKHGNLRPLADINLAPVNFITMEFRFVGVDRETESLEVKLNQTVLEFRKWVAKTILGMPVNSFQLYYVDKGILYEGGVCLRNNNKKLYAYRMNEGDEIRLEVK